MAIRKEKGIKNQNSSIESKNLEKTVQEEINTDQKELSGTVNQGNQHSNAYVEKNLPLIELNETITSSSNKTTSLKYFGYDIFKRDPSLFRRQDFRNIFF